MKGRRRPDTSLSKLPEDIQPGDYWKVLDTNNEPMKSNSPSNLTGEVWMVIAPGPEDFGGMLIGRLEHHTVREHEDGTISVRPGDGSSNSIMISCPSGASWHGYIERGEWQVV